MIFVYFVDCFGVVIVGSVIVDVIIFLGRFFVCGEIILGDEFILMFGGKGVNQVVVVGCFGVCISFVGCVGDDLFYDFVVDGLIEVGVDFVYLCMVFGFIGIVYICVDVFVQNDIVMVLFVNVVLSVEQIDEVFVVFVLMILVLFMQLEILFVFIVYIIV